MAPVRRYLRISKYSVLECRIYLDNPSLAQSWLLNPRKPVLPRIIESIRPLVLPKLREERERGKKKSSKKRSIKDVITQDDFEISMFLTETSTRHSLLSKKKHFREKGPQMMQSNSTKLISETNNHVVVDIDGEPETAALPRGEDSDDANSVRLSDIPAARQKRRRAADTSDIHSGDSGESDSNSIVDLDSDAEQPATKRARVPSALENGASDGQDDKKKLVMDVSYEGFAIYGRVLCLVVRRREPESQRRRQDGTAPDGQARMENWITSTQMPVGEEVA